MTLSDFFESTAYDCETHRWIHNSHNSGTLTIDSLVRNLGKEIVRFRCRRCPQHFDAWEDKAENSSPLDDASRLALQAFLGPTFGTPNHEYPEPNIDHLEGFVGEWLWYFLSTEMPSETIVHTMIPGFKSTDPGGDALIVHRLPNEELFFRLWEMKKFAPRANNSTQRISATVSKAYSQLNSKAVEYLARAIATEQVLDEPELEDFLGQLLDLWIDSSPQAAAGVSIATSSNHFSLNCFDDFGNHFPQMTNPVRLLGMLTGIDDFSAFAVSVKEYVWTGL